MTDKELYQCTVDHANASTSPLQFERLAGFEELPRSSPPSVDQLRKRLAMSRRIRVAIACLTLGVAVGGIGFFRTPEAQLIAIPNQELESTEMPFRANLVWTAYIPIADENGSDYPASYRWQAQEIVVPIDPEIMSAESRAVIQQVLYQPTQSTLFEF